LRTSDDLEVCHFGAYLDNIEKEGSGWKIQPGAFPLLVKFIDAKDNLSVQVHPNDDDALEHEGKYGKNEMWHVVGCEPSVFFISAGTVLILMTAISLLLSAWQGWTNAMNVNEKESAIDSFFVQQGEKIVVYGSLKIIVSCM